MATSNMGPEGNGNDKIYVDYGGWIQESIDHFKQYLGDYIVAALVFVVALVVSWALCLVPGIILSGPLVAGLYYFTDKKMKGEETEIGDLFYPAKNYLVDSLLVFWIIVLAVGIIGLIVFLILNFIPILGQLLSLVVSLVLGGVCTFMLGIAMLAIIRGDAQGVGAVNYAYEKMMKEPLHLIIYATIASIIRDVGFGLCFVPGLVTLPFSYVMIITAYDNIAGKSAGEGISEVNPPPEEPSGGAEEPKEPQQ